jgi:hypothetical protein
MCQNLKGAVFREKEAILQGRKVIWVIIGIFALQKT